MHTAVDKGALTSCALNWKCPELAIELFSPPSGMSLADRKVTTPGIFCGCFNYDYD